ncbi:MAG: glycosyltransferase [Candidatus Woesearchaeota archaeon]
MIVNEKKSILNKIENNNKDNIKKKLLFILPSPTIGGAEIQALYLLNNLDFEKLEVYCGFLYENKLLEDEFLKNKNIKIIKFNKKGEWDLFVYFKILNFLKRNQIDIIQTFLGNHHAYIPSLFYKKVKCILGIRATSKRKGFLLNLIRYDLPKFILKFRDIVFVSNSKSGKEIYVKNGIPENRIIVINNGIDIKKFSQGNRYKIIREFELYDEKYISSKNNNKISGFIEKDKNIFVIGMVARLMESKNQQAIIKITKNLKEKFSNIRFKVFIIGDGPNRKNLEKLTNELNLNNEIIFTGARKDIPDFLSAMDLFVFPSLFPEGWPNVIGEAMAAGLPIISYDIGDVKEIITNYYNGIITECNEKIFEDKIVELIKNDNLRKKLAMNAKRTIKKYDISVMVKEYEKIYLDLDY